MNVSSVDIAQSNKREHMSSLILQAFKITLKVKHSNLLCFSEPFNYTLTIDGIEHQLRQAPSPISYSKPLENEERAYV